MADLAKFILPMLYRSHEMLYMKKLDLIVEDMVANGAKIAKLHLELDKVCEEVNRREAKGGPVIKVEAQSTSKSTESGENAKDCLAQNVEHTPAEPSLPPSTVKKVET